MWNPNNSWPSAILDITYYFVGPVYSQQTSWTLECLSFDRPIVLRPGVSLEFATLVLEHVLGKGWNSVVVFGWQLWVWKNIWQNLAQTYLQHLFDKTFRNFRSKFDKQHMIRRQTETCQTLPWNIERKKRIVSNPIHVHAVVEDALPKWGDNWQVWLARGRSEKNG